MSELARKIEALLFLSSQPVPAADLAEAAEAREGQVAEAIEVLREDLAEGRRGIILREAASRSPPIPPSRPPPAVSSPSRGRRP